MTTPSLRMSDPLSMAASEVLTMAYKDKEKKRMYNAAYRAANLECIKAQQTKWRAANKDKLREDGIEYHKRYYEKNKEVIAHKAAERRIKDRGHVLAIQAKSREKHREKIRAWHREYHAKNRAEINAKRAVVDATSENRERKRIRSHKSYLANRDAVRARHAAYYQANKKKWRLVYEHTRRSLERGAIGAGTEEQVFARVKFFGECCAYCGKPYTTIDHAIPLSRKGTNWPANLRPACKSCNSRKGQGDWRAWRPII